MPDQLQRLVSLKGHLESLVKHHEDSLGLIQLHCNVLEEVFEVEEAKDFQRKITLEKKTAGAWKSWIYRIDESLARPESVPDTFSSLKRYMQRNLMSYMDNRDQMHQYSVLLGNLYRSVENLLAWSLHVGWDFQTLKTWYDSGGAQADLLILEMGKEIRERLKKYEGRLGEFGGSGPQDGIVFPILVVARF